jgi:hypothetical protein
MRRLTDAGTAFVFVKQPHGVDPDASIAKGVLKVTVPKPVPAKATKIEIKTAAAWSGTVATSAFRCRWRGARCSFREVKHPFHVGRIANEIPWVTGPSNAKSTTQPAAANGVGPPVRVERSDTGLAV